MLILFHSADTACFTGYLQCKKTAQSMTENSSKGAKYSFRQMKLMNTPSMKRTTTRPNQLIVVELELLPAGPSKPLCDCRIRMTLRPITWILQYNDSSNTKAHSVRFTANQLAARSCVSRIFVDFRDSFLRGLYLYFALLRVS